MVIPETENVTTTRREGSREEFREFLRYGALSWLNGLINTLHGAIHVVDISQ